MRTSKYFKKCLHMLRIQILRIKLQILSITVLNFLGNHSSYLLIRSFFSVFCDSLSGDLQLTNVFANSRII